jgi:hypothetical protein
MRFVRQTFLLGLSAWLILASVASVANARIKTPQIEEIVASADLIVVGEVDSVRATPPELWRQIIATILLIAAAAVLAFLLWRRKFAIAACLVVAGLLGVSLFIVPFGTYRKVAVVSVSSTLKGSPSPSTISVYHDHGFVCDVTHFDVGQEYVLFLRQLSSGYTTSWYDWSVWIIKAGYAQTERRTWHDTPPIAVGEFTATIRELRNRQRKTANGKGDTPAP